MKLRVVSRRKGQELDLEGAPDGMGLHKSGNAVVALGKGAVVVEIDEECARALGDLFKDENSAGGG